MDKPMLQNPFPVEVFPASLQRIVRDLHTHVGYPVDFASAALLYAASVAVGNTHKVYLKQGFVEGAALYMAIVGRPGTNKTQPIKFALTPLLKRDEVSYSAFREVEREYDRISSLSAKERLHQGLELPDKPVWAKTILGDFTLEALVEAHRINLRGIGVYADELASWFKNFNRYSKGSEMEFWLSTWSGAMISFDRKSSTPCLIPRPFISVIGSIQPAVLHELAKDSRGENGFIDRMLFVAPEGLEKQPWSDTDLPASVPSDWGRILSNLIERPLRFDEHGRPEPRVLHFTQEAREAILDWQRALTAECVASGSDMLTSICSKLEVYAVRFSLLLQLLSYAAAEGEREAVELSAVKGAIKLVDYFKHNALKVRDGLEEPYALTRLTTDKRRLYEVLSTSFYTADALKMGRLEGLSERTIKSFLRDNSLFEREKQGSYRKRF